MEPFATVGDLENRYKISEDDEDRNRYSELLAAASRIIRQRLPGIDSRTDLDPDLVKDVVCEMVWYAVFPTSTPGATQQTQSVGSVSVSTTYETAAGRLRLTRTHLALLRPARASSRASSVSTAPAGYERAPGTEYPWWRY